MDDKGVFLDQSKVKERVGLQSLAGKPEIIFHLVWHSLGRKKRYNLLPLHHVAASYFSSTFGAPIGLAGSAFFIWKCVSVQALFLEK